MSHHLTSLQPALEQTPATPFSILTSSHHNTTTSAAFASPDQTASLNLHHILTHFHYSPIHRRRNWRNCCYYHALPEDFSSGLKASRPTYNTYIHTAYCILLQKWVILHCSYIDTPPLSQTRNYLLCLWILLLLHKTLSYQQWEQEEAGCLLCVQGEGNDWKETKKVLVWTLNPHITSPEAFKMRVMNILNRAIFSGNLEIVIKPRDLDN